MNTQAKWIRVGEDIGEISPVFQKRILIGGAVKKATARVSAMGLYNLFCNGKKVGNALLAPGFTSYVERVLYQEYDLLPLLKEGENTLEIVGGKGWAVGGFGPGGPKCKNFAEHISVIADVEIDYQDGKKQTVVTDTDWSCFTSCILDSELYNGETVDLTAEIRALGQAVEDTAKKPALEKQIHGAVTEQERLSVRQVIKTPKGETVLDFGQNIAGYAEFRVHGRRGDRIVVSHAEVLDRDGNFYTENMRSAKNRNTYVLSGGNDLFKPSFCHQGFRYIRLDEYPEELDLTLVKAVVIHSEMKRTGHFRCGDKRLNRLYENIIWGQKGNFVEIPTDCPQRDERLGWTADLQVFCRTAAINYDIETFIDKWLWDMSLEQREDGAVFRVVPYFHPQKGGKISTGWSDAATVVPWEIYRAYGNRELLERYYPMMTAWIKYLRGVGEEEFLWIGGDHYGDWLAMDAGDGVYLGATQTDLLASAYFAHSTELVIKAGRVLGRDVSDYESLWKNIKAAFRKAFMKDGLPVIYPKADAFDTRRPVKADTQTACAMILSFGLCEEEERQALADHLADLIKQNNGLMTTGFLGTPLLLHTLAQNGYMDLAYSLLLETRMPSWLFSVERGATTMWEHWDGIREDGSFWSPSMNSFNHYAYGSVFDWIFEYVGGISICEDGAGYSHVTVAPVPNKSIGWAETGIETKYGELTVGWFCEGDAVRYEITVPHGVRADLRFGNVCETVTDGRYVYYSNTESL